MGVFFYFATLFQAVESIDIEHYTLPDCITFKSNIKIMNDTNSNRSSTKWGKNIVMWLLIIALLLVVVLSFGYLVEIVMQ